MLHIINKSCDRSHALQSCLKRAAPDDCVLLIEDAVLCAREVVFLKVVVRTKLKVYALKPDLEVRGIAATDCAKEIELLDYAGFVALVEINNPVQSWF